MKQIPILILLFFAFHIGAQSAYISTNGDIILYSGSIEKYSTPDLICTPRFNVPKQIWTVTVQIIESGGISTGNFKKAFEIEYDAATINGYTASGSSTTDKLMNAILQAVAATLGGLNGGVTFTLH